MQYFSFARFEFCEFGYNLIFQVLSTLNKPKLWQNSRTQTVTQLKKNKLWQNLKDQIVTKLKNWNRAKLKKINCDNSKTQIVIVIKITVVTEVFIMTSFSKNTLTPWQPTTLRAAFWNSCDVLSLTFFSYFLKFPPDCLDTELWRTSTQTSLWCPRKPTVGKNIENN